MRIFFFDNTFEGILTAVFDAYARRTFPDKLLREGEIPPLFCEETYTVITDKAKAERVWNGLRKKLSDTALSELTQCWLSELPEVSMLLFRYICKAVEAPAGIETNFADPDVLELSKIWRKVSGERLRMLQFVRFQRTADGMYYAALEPLYNVLPLTIAHFKDRFSDQRWLIYDIFRSYGYYYDLKEVREVFFKEGERGNHLITGMLDDALLDEEERMFQKLWQTYFKAICIKERMNPRKHRQDMPVRYWKYLTEKQG